MDLLSPYLFHFTIFIISLSLVFIWKIKSRAAYNLPHGNKSWPFIGETLEFFLAGKRGEPEKFIDDRTSKYSTDVFRMSMLGNDVAVFCSEDANRFLLSTANKYLKVWLPEASQKAIGATVHDVEKLRSVLPEFLKTDALKHYIPIMDSMAKQHLEADWLPNKEVKALPLLKKLTLALACKLFLNVTAAEDISRIEKPFAALVEGMLSIPINFPGTAYRGALKATKIIHKNILSIIEKRRRELCQHAESVAPDLLTRILLKTDEDGKAAFSDKEIPSMIVALLMASHDTITSAIVFVLKYLAENPSVYSEVLKEQMEIGSSKGPGDLLDWNDVQNMKYSWCVGCESLRIAPPSQGNFRETIADFTYQGFTIPKGWKAYWSPYSTHKNPKYFKDPEKFEPSRFQGNPPRPYTYVPFGRGPHMCPGKEFARIGMLVFMHNIVTKFKWQTIIPDEKITFTATIIPAGGLPIRLQPHDN
nr:cytochrome P450 716E53 [Tripterygium hypoglaucum]